MDSLPGKKTTIIPFKLFNYPSVHRLCFGGGILWEAYHFNGLQICQNRMSGTIVYYDCNLPFQLGKLNIQIVDVFLKKVGCHPRSFRMPINKVVWWFNIFKTPWLSKFPNYQNWQSFITWHITTNENGYSFFTFLTSNNFLSLKVSESNFQNNPASSILKISFHEKVVKCWVKLHRTILQSFLQ